MNKRPAADIVRDLRAVADNDNINLEDAERAAIREAADRLEAASNTSVVRELGHGLAIRRGFDGQGVYEVGNIARTIAATIASGDIEERK